jgi:NAD(P)-dependent dehydrogenase (short-subunit alcohol dehydrogenase family)
VFQAHHDVHKLTTSAILFILQLPSIYTIKMPNIKIIRETLAELPNGPPLVVAVTGGTTGIGSYVAKALATTFAKSGSKLRVYIVGRNATRAESVIAQGQEISPGSEWRFVKGTDLALISEVDRASAEIIRQETEAPFHGGPARLDLLYMSHCYPILKERSSKSLDISCFGLPHEPVTRQNQRLIFCALATTEGLDAFLSTTYYSRIRFTLKLMPLLTASPTPAHVVSIYAGGMEDGTAPGELPLGCPPPAIYGVSAVRKYTCFMKAFFFEDLAEKHAGKVSFSHVYPGLVDGPAFSSPDMPTWFKIIWTFLKPIALLVYMTPPDTCGEAMLYVATPRYTAKGGLENDQKLLGGVEVARGTDGEVGSGAYALGQRADEWSKGKSYEKVRTEETHKQVWDHTMEVLDGIEKENQNPK